MAQASSAQREPSMEEILASIRRIIEDSDQGRRPSELEQPPRFETSGERGEGAVIEVDAFRAELRGRTERNPAPRPADPDPKTASGDIQAHVARDVAYKAEPAYPAYEDEPAASLPEAVASSAFPAAEGEDAEARSAETNVERHEVGLASAASVEPSHQAQRPAIISEQAGRQVAAAFSELSEAFAASRRKSFDEMAEEMLRPMLQEWLDNNLPMLVERLVREEIERVARGV